MIICCEGTYLNSFTPGEWEEAKKNLSEETMNVDTSIESIEKMIFKIAWKYSRYMPIDDLVQEGYIGALIAQKKYDSSRNVKFSTYAFWWIKNAITEAVERSRFVPLPNRKYNQERWMLKSMDSGKSFDDAVLDAGLDREDAMLILRSRDVVSVDAEIDGKPVAEKISDGGFRIEEIENNQIIENVLSFLKHDEREVYVLFHAYEMKTSEIAEMLNLPKEKVSKLLFYATKKVKRVANRLK